MQKTKKYTLLNIVTPIQRAFAEFEISGLILLAATITAMILANTNLGESIHHFWNTPIVVGIGSYSFSCDLHILINDVLMTLFFVVVGGEIKREVVDGALSTKEKAILPIIGAVGGMVFPGLIFVLFNHNLPTSGGWGIPTATDIAFSLAVLSILGKKVPFSLKIFLAALAIADDLGAIIVIAFFYSNTINVYYLAGAFVVVFLFFISNRSGISRLTWYCILGIILWILIILAGIHPTIAGVIFAMSVPYRLNNYSSIFHTQLHILKENLILLSNNDTKDIKLRGELIEIIQNESKKMEAPLQNVLHFLLPISSFVIMPLFAFANSGIVINLESFTYLTSPLSLGIIFGLMLGKSIGITLFSWLAIKLKIANMPENINWMHIYGMAWIAGIGFTMSMFVTQLAFVDATYIETAKLSIIIASILSGIIGYAILRYFAESPQIKNPR